jgi:hypothetical protein
LRDNEPNPKLPAGAMENGMENGKVIDPWLKTPGYKKYILLTV